MLVGGGLSARGENWCRAEEAESSYVRDGDHKYRWRNILWGRVWPVGHRILKKKQRKYMNDEWMLGTTAGCRIVMVS